jgi:hypothetical protein
MASTVTIAKNFGPLADLPLTDRALMREVGLLARERVIRRTLSGVDEDDQAFAPYSLGYAKAKAATLGSARVNLQVSGAMLNAIQIIEVTDTSVTLGFAG